jgi:hypothetical protein
MQRQRYPYKAAAVYADAAGAEAAVEALEASDLDDIKVFHLDSGTSDPDEAIEPETQSTRDRLVKETAAGGVAGTGAGAVAAGAAALVTPALFVSAPVVGPLIVLGYGAMIGGTVGAVHGLKLRENLLAGLVKDTLKAGYHVVLIHAPSEVVEHRVHEIIESTMAEDSFHT